MDAGLTRMSSHYSQRCNGAFTPEQDNDKTKVEPVHFYYAFHTRCVGPGVKGIIEMHRFNICLVVVLSLSCSGVKAPLYTGEERQRSSALLHHI